MSAPEYRRLVERLRELATQAAGDMRTIQVGRFAEELPEGLPLADELRRTLPSEQHDAGQPRVEIGSVRLRGRRHPPTGSKQVRSIEVDVRVVRGLPLDAIKSDDARYDEHGFATEDGELLAQAIEWPPNLERTNAGELTGCRSLVHVSSDGKVRSGPKGAGFPQLIETIHRFRGFIVIDTPIS